VTTDCLELRDRIAELVEGDLDGAEAERLSAHAASCESCRHEIRLQEEVVAALRAWPPAPDVDVPLPDLGDARLHTAFPWRVAGLAATAAAALLVAAAAWLGGFERASPEIRPGTTAGPSDLVEIRMVIDSGADAPLPDDGLLALTAGVEAVVMRRPAQRR
jgi:anti-sigma factor RsiW